MLHTDMPDVEKIEPMLTTTEVARLIHVHPSTLRRWSDSGLIRAYRIGPRADRRYREDDITCFLVQLKGESKEGSGMGTGERLGRAQRRNASDLHSRVSSPPVLRIDGALMPWLDLSPLVLK